MQSQVSFNAKVSKKRLGINERLRIDFEMNENGDNFNPPQFTNFQVVSGPQQSVSRSWVNGVQSFSKTYTYFLTPKTKGRQTALIPKQYKKAMNEEYFACHWWASIILPDGIVRNQVLLPFTEPFVVPKCLKYGRRHQRKYGEEKDDADAESLRSECRHC